MQMANGSRPSHRQSDRLYSIRKQLKWCTFLPLVAPVNSHECDVNAQANGVPTDQI